jgi:hypothetical protein
MDSNGWGGVVVEQYHEWSMKVYMKVYLGKSQFDVT